MELLLKLLVVLSCRALAGLSLTDVQAQEIYTDSSQNESQSQFNASFGDIMLELLPTSQASKVLLYYGTWQRVAGWGEICADVPIGDYHDRIATVICQQAGWKSGQFSTQNRDNKSHPVWLYNINCDGSDPAPHHILRCRYNLTSTNECTSSVAVQCSASDGRLNETKNRYRGQVQLCPPDGFSEGRSISTGLVMLYLYDSWQAINIMSEEIGYSRDVLDSLCRQLGYTNAVINSAMATHASRLMFTSCYSLTQYSWLTTDQLDCGGTSLACLSCCYHYPSKQCGLPQCHQSNDLVVSCTFDTSLTSPPTEGSSHMCAFSSNYSGASLNSAACQDQQEIPLRTFEIVVGVTGPLAIIFFLLAVVGFCCCCVCWYKRRRHHPGEEPIIPNHDRRRNHEDPGN